MLCFKFIADETNERPCGSGWRVSGGDQDQPPLSPTLPQSTSDLSRTGSSEDLAPTSSSHGSQASDTLEQPRLPVDTSPFGRKIFVIRKKMYQMTSVYLLAPIVDSLFTGRLMFDILL